jgi:hypothetical protein
MRSIPNLRAPDFVGRLAFWLALLVFLLLTFLTYLVLCSLSPALLTGWAKVTGVTEDTTEFIASVPYPLYIAAALVGLAQFILPISNFGSIQRNAIHSLIGVPKKLVQFARYLFDKLIVSEDKSALSDFVIRLTSTQWQTNLSAFADSGFYASHLRRLELDDDTERKGYTQRFNA